MGTAKAGLYASDGQKLRVFHPQFAKTQVTALAGDEDQFWVGTQADGAWLWRGGVALHMTADLPDPQVLSMCVRGEKAWIGTPLGIAEFSNGQFSRRLGDGIFAQGLAEYNGTLWVATADEGTIALPLTARTPRPRAAELTQVPQTTVAFGQAGENLLAVRESEIAELPGGERVIAADGKTLASGHVTALYADARGELWVGYFDRGMDVVDQSHGWATRHFENDVLFCVNRIKENPIKDKPGNGTVAVGTANGLALFDAEGNLRQTFDRKTGLIASHVTDVLFRDGGGGEPAMVVATPAGLSFFENGVISSIYAFQGLVNNHVYTLAELNGILYAGTLGGFSAVRNGLVQASFTTANSKLRQNWITASAVFNGKLYLGTYGSGVVEMERDESIRSFADFSTGRFEINPNAMLASGRALYAGIAGRGLAVLRKSEERWQFLAEGLPSLNVTAIEERNGTIYVGTDNGLVRIQESDLLP